MLKAKDFRFYAREALRGRWFRAGGVGILAGILGASLEMSGAGSGGSSSTGSNSGGSVAGTAGIANNMMDSEISGIFMAIVLGVLLVALIYAIVMAVIGGATTLGYAKYNLNLVDDKNPRVGDLFSQYNRLGTGFGMQFFRGLFIFLWSLLFVIPGIIAGYSYQMTPYILCEHPEMTAREAIRESKQLMKGNKWRLFCLEFSFLGWIFLVTGVTMISGGLIIAPLAMGVSSPVYEGSAVTYVFIILIILIMAVMSVLVSLILSPYMTASGAVFYREISEGRYSNPHIDGEAAYEYDTYGAYGEANTYTEESQPEHNMFE